MTDHMPINCIQCRHYYVTWDPKFPRGCRAYGFKTQQMPSALVLSSSGKPCLQSEPKNGSRPAKA